MESYNINPSNEQTDIQDKRILIADADIQSRNLLALVLRKLGAAVEEIGNGKEAYELLQDKTYRKKDEIDLLIMGINMPQMDGINLLRMLRDHNLLKELPVFVMHYSNEDKELHECRCLGISDNIPKPVNVVDAISAIANTFARIKKAKKEDLPTQPSSTTEYTESGFPVEYQNIATRDTYPLKTSFYRCPFCDQTFTAPKIKEKSLDPDPTDQLLIGLYSPGSADFEHVVPFLVDVICCPSCLWTADREGFLRIWNRDTAKIHEITKVPKNRWEFPAFNLTPKLKNDFTLFLRKRLEYVHKISDLGEALFSISKIDRKFPRNFADAQISIDLALFCNEFVIKNSDTRTRSILRHKGAEYYIKKQHIASMMIERIRKKEDKKTLLASRIEAIIKAMELMLQVDEIDLPTLQHRCKYLRQKYFLAHMLSNILRNPDQKLRIIQHRDNALQTLNEILANAVANKNTIEARIINKELDAIVNHINISSMNFPG